MELSNRFSFTMQVFVFLVLAIFQPSSTIRVERSAITYVWDDGIIPYQFQPDFAQKDRKMFITATQIIAQNTCVRFRSKTDNDRFWVKVINGGCCGAQGGRVIDREGQGQDMTMSADLPLPFYLHEMGHVLGLPHEQDRQDRDDWIFWDNNKPGCPGGKFATPAGNLDQAALDVHFDYVSLMADWTECYWPKPEKAPKNIPLGPGTNNNRTFSVLDYEKINAIYDCRGCFGYRFRKIEQLAGYHKPYVAGWEVNKRSFYICRVYHEGHLVLGKSLPDDKKCYVSGLGDQGEKEYKEGFAVFTNPYGANLKWIKGPGDGTIPRNAVKGGRIANTIRETVYIGRCQINLDEGRSTLIPGYVLASNGREVRIGWGGGTTKCTDFEFLVCEQ